MKNDFSKKQALSPVCTPTNKTITHVGELALNYMNGYSQEFPKDCPDPRVDAQAFADWCRKNGYA